MTSLAYTTARSDTARTLAPVQQRPLKVHWARHLDEVRAAQRLRHEVFVLEGGARPISSHSTTGTGSSTDPGLDIDAFDDACEHLLVSLEATDESAEQVVGTYRVLLPDAARRMGQYYTETEFDIQSLNGLRPTLAELGRSCIAGPWRTGGVILMLWSHLVRFLIANGAQHAIGCASVGMADGGANAARLWRELQGSHLAPQSLRVMPHLPLPVHLLPQDGQADWPPLVKGYVKCGAKVLGAPAWDSDFGCADLPMLLDIAGMTPAYRKRFLGE